MTPITIKDSIQNLTDIKLRNKLNFMSYTFCVNADFSKAEAMDKLVNDLEEHTLEALLRVLDFEIGYRPYQNKIYEQVENVFDDQDAYNINRMMSSLRRTKMMPINPSNEKYIKWMKNRIKYGVKTLMECLEDIDYSEEIIEIETNADYVENIFR